MRIFTKLKDFMGLSDERGYEYDYEEAEGSDYQESYQEESGSLPVEEEPRHYRRRDRAIGTPSLRAGEGMGNVIGMPGAANGMSQVMLMEPRSFEEMPQAIQALRERKSVVLNLTMMDPDQAQRAVDFVAGGTYAIDGHQERIGDSIFLFAPSCVQVVSPHTLAEEAPVRPARPAVPAPAWGSPSDLPLSRFAQ